MLIDYEPVDLNGLLTLFRRGKPPRVAAAGEPQALPDHEASMTLDQKIQVWVAVGTWLAGLATLAAVIVALHLARRTERVRLKVHVGHLVVIAGDGSPFQEHLSISVTNLGERSVTINSVGWAVGKRSQRKYCIQSVSGPFTTQFPVELAHGKNANFMVSFLATPNWLRDFMAMESP